VFWDSLVLDDVIRVRFPARHDATGIGFGRLIDEWRRQLNLIDRADQVVE